MKKVILISLISLSCGKYNLKCLDACPQTPTQSPSQKVQQCTVSEASGGAVIACPDGTQTFIKNGKDGPQGSPGISGSQGVPGDTGPTGAAGPMGPVGPQGVSGVNGKDGADGQNCSVAYSSVGAVISCPGGSSVTVMNGINGQNGTSVVAVKLCADSSAGFPEYAFQVGDGLYAVYYGYLDRNGNPSSAQNGTLEAFMAKLTPGSYVSTNGTGCSFRVNANGSISR